MLSRCMKCAMGRSHVLGESVEGVLYNLNKRKDLSRAGPTEIYSTIDACQTAQEMWEAIERLQQVNELRAERMAKNVNPLALVATAQTLQDPYYQSTKPHKSYAPTSKASLPPDAHATTR
ncbi:hypothetical protein Tco_1344258 [Tanacetum coccineum]